VQYFDIEQFTIMSSSTINFSQMSPLIVANAALASNRKAMWVLLSLYGNKFAHVGVTADISQGLSLW
jgi:hypothetical protein